MGQAIVQETLDQLVEASSKARELLRDIRTETKELRQIIRDGEQLVKNLRSVISDFTESDIENRVRGIIEEKMSAELNVLSAEITEAMEDSVRRVARELNRISGTFQS